MARALLCLAMALVTGVALGFGEENYHSKVKRTPKEKYRKPQFQGTDDNLAFSKAGHIVQNKPKHLNLPSGHCYPFSKKCQSEAFKGMEDRYVPKIRLRHGGSTARAEMWVENEQTPEHFTKLLIAFDDRRRLIYYHEFDGTEIGKGEVRFHMTFNSVNATHAVAKFMVDEKHDKVVAYAYTNDNVLWMSEAVDAREHHEWARNPKKYREAMAKQRAADRGEL